MKFSYNWLRELSGTKKSPGKLAEVLSLRAFEVESVEKIKGDSVLEIKILADRGHDCLSHIGIAREICAIEGRKMANTGAKLLYRSLAPVLKVEIKDKKLCPRYIGVVMNNIKVKPSPLWMQRRLEATGLRPINNIVDATNYVMLETGQPMHAFDFEKVSSGKSEILNPKSETNSKSQIQNSKVNIIVRRAKRGEKIKLLDETELELTDEDLVIANEKRALALAGIMGGIDSGIDLAPPEISQVIILEAANFNSIAIRKSRIRLELKTDSSDRFEKGLDPNLAEIAMARAVQIITAMGGKAEGIVDVYQAKVKPWKINLDVNYVNKLLGENIPVNTVIKILNSLGIKVAGKGGSTSKWRLNLQIPTFRLDLRTQEDLIEEIGRIYGYNKIAPQAPKIEIKMPAVNESRQFERLVKNILAGKGFSEVYNYSFYSQRDANLAELGVIEHLELENPMNPDQALMRVSLIPGILKNLSENLKRFKDILIFETGKVYWKNKDVLPEERRMITAAVVISKKQDMRNKTQNSLFYIAKGYCDALLEKLGVDDYYFDTFDAVPVDTPLALWHEGRSAAVKIEGSNDTIGYVGEINPLVLSNFDIHERVSVFKLNLDKLQKIAEAEREFEPIRKYPEVLRDISMVAHGNILVDEILQTIQKAGGDLILDVDLFDIYDFEDGTSSYAFHIIFGADNRTLESREVDGLMEKIISSLEKELRVKIRK